MSQPLDFALSISVCLDISHSFLLLKEYPNLSSYNIFSLPILLLLGVIKSLAAYVIGIKSIGTHLLKTSASSTPRCTSKSPSSCFINSPMVRPWGSTLRKISFDIQSRVHGWYALSSTPNGLACFDSRNHWLWSASIMEPITLLLMFSVLVQLTSIS